MKNRALRKAFDKSMWQSGFAGLAEERPAALTFPDIVTWPEVNYNMLDAVCFKSAAFFQALGIIGSDRNRHDGAEEDI